MSAFQIVVLALLVLLDATYLAYLRLRRGQIEEQSSIWVHGKEVPVTLRFGSALPKVLRAKATTLKNVICFRQYPRNSPAQVVAIGPIAVELAAHECGHVVRWVEIGSRRWWTEIWTDILRHPFKHDARPSEVRATVDGALILAGKLDDVDASTLLRRFR